MVSGTLYTYPDNYRAHKIQIAAAYSDSNVKVDSSFVFGQTNTTDDFLKKFPLGKVPAFQDSNGACFNESNAIAHFVSNETLKGTTPVDKALVLQYQEFAENEILPSACTWVYPTLGFKQYNKQETEKAQTHLKKCMEMLNSFLETRTFLVGERITLADITLACNMMMLYAKVFDPKFRGPYGNVNRWFLTCVNQPHFKSVIGEFKLCETMATFDNKKYQELHPKKGKEAKPKQEKQQQQPKQEKKPAKEEKDTPEPAAVEKPKKVDLFANVPKSDFVLDDWKRFYSNNKAEDFLPYLWEKYDPNAWSLWFGNYKYNDENKVDFMAINLIGGMYQRLEGCRKHLFGVNLTIKEKINDKDCYAISGVWLQRGQDLIFDLGADSGWNYDAEQFEFRKLDPLNNQTDKDIVESYFNWEGPYLAGKEIDDGMAFK